jgi:arginyl-tRNA synthetase
MGFNLINQQKDIAKRVSEIIGIELPFEWVEVANSKSGAHLALPCFRLSAQLGKSPADVSLQIAKDFSADSIEHTEAVGPYLNFWFSAQTLSEWVNSNETLHGHSTNQQIAIVEFLSPNLAKPLSIGHLRNALQGRALTRAYKHAGFEVITDNHIGDWGTVFGMWVVGFERFSSEQQLSEGGVKELGRMYIEVRKAIKEESQNGGSELEDLVQSWLQKLENNDEKALEYHNKFSEISLQAVERQMAELGIHFDYNLGESFYIKMGKAMVEELLAAGQAIQNDDGSVVVPLEEQNIDTPMLIEKANGAALYATSDIATIKYREEKWNPHLVVYVVGSEQQFHFKQLFAANEKCRWSDAELVHHWYGLIEEVDENGKRSKMSSRTNAVFMADLIQLAVEKARDMAPAELSDEDVKKIALGALTFREFSASHTGNTVFDWESMFSLSGFSGPYVQYAAVRISSIMEKAGATSVEYISEYDWSQHKDVLWQITQFETVVEEATQMREFHKVAEFAYELARSWNRFYESTPVLNSEGREREARLWLAQTIYAYLERALYLLGIDIPSKM